MPNVSKILEQDNEDLSVNAAPLFFLWDLESVRFSSKGILNPFCFPAAATKHEESELLVRFGQKKSKQTQNKRSVQNYVINNLFILFVFPPSFFLPGSMSCSRLPGLRPSTNIFLPMNNLRYTVSTVSMS